jgi:hypothetical protein
MLAGTDLGIQFGMQLLQQKDKITFSISTIIRSATAHAEPPVDERGRSAREKTKTTEIARKLKRRRSHAPESNEFGCNAGRRSKESGVKGTW